MRDGGTPTSLALTVACAVNQSFFTGMFCLLAGYFTPASLRRKRMSQFLQERLLRLGVPLLGFGFVLGPLAVAWAGVPDGRPLRDGWLQQLSQARFVIGPLWFAWALPAALKFAIVGVSSISASFAIAGGLLRVPGARRIL